MAIYVSIKLRICLPFTYNIEGVGEFTADEIREMRNGGLRQSDYTRKTQELARQREEMKEAQELYDYLRANPHIVQAMHEADKKPASVTSKAALSVDYRMLRDVLYNLLEQSFIRFSIQL